MKYEVERRGARCFVHSMLEMALAVDGGVLLTPFPATDSFSTFSWKIVAPSVQDLEALDSSLPHVFAAAKYNG